MQMFHLNNTKFRYSIFILLTLALLASCQKIYDNIFNIAWNEEIQLHNGKIIVAHIKLSYERLDVTSKYDKAILRDTEISFDSGFPNGRVTQILKRVQPRILEQDEKGTWYLVIDEIGGYSPHLTGQNWGPIQNAQGLRILRLNKNGFEPIPISQFPEQLSLMNMLFDSAPIKELSQLNGRRVDLKFKKEYLKKYPLHPEDISLQKPAIIIHTSAIKGE